MNDNNLRYGKTYCCKRTRLLEALQNAGFKFYAVVPERPDSKYLNWLYENSPELELFLAGYFAAKK